MIIRRKIIQKALNQLKVNELNFYNYVYKMNDKINLYTFKRANGNREYSW